MKRLSDSAEPQPSNRWLAGRGHVLALLVLIGSVTLVVIMWRVAWMRELRAAEAEFVHRTTTLTELLQQRLVKYELVARGGAALFASVKRPTPGQWDAYVDGMDIRGRFPAMTGFGFAGYVSDAKVDALESEWAQAGYGTLQVRPTGERDHYGPILYLQPKSARNAAAVGFDMYADPARRAAMRRAMQSGKAALSGPLALVPGGDQRATGLALVMPIYKGGAQPRSARSRRELMRGWVFVSFRLQPLVTSVLGDSYPDLGLAVRDITDDRAQLLYRSNATSDAGEPAFRHRVEISPYGRRWELSFASAPLAIAAPRTEGLRTALLLGLFASLLMYAVAWALARTEARAHRIARRMTEDYRRSEMRFRTAMEYSAIGKALLDSRGCIVEANPALGTIVGRPPQSLVSERFESLFEDHGDESGEHVLDPDEAGPDGVYRSSRRLHRSGGAARHVRLTYAPVPGSVGEDIVGLVQADDVTERVRAQARVQALNRTLEARVAERTRELRLANRELEAFAYSVSHDLRAPLRAIDGFSRILVERHAAALDDSGRSYLGRVRKASSRMGELIEALLKMTRVSRDELRKERVDLGKLASEVVEILRASDPGHEVTVDIAPGLWAQGDTSLLRSLVLNLIGNAWKFSHATPGARIEFGRRAAADGGDEFFVRDNGSGFKQEYVGKLFRPFQRLHDREQFEGHGIGLASVKRIVERHGGTIRAEGREGEGATFYFTLPAAEARDVAAGN